VAESKIILYADDDVDDRTWFSEACRAVSQSWQVHFVETGHQVIDYLRSKHSLEPSLILLDLNMPGMDGRQTLKQIKEDRSFQQIPVVMVTTSINRIDKEVCHRLGADLLITKPDTMGKWQQVILQLQSLVV
jgi:CheY-like chemotaxis protein